MGVFLQRPVVSNVLAIWLGYSGRHSYPHGRVGLEDNLYLKKGVLARSNAELVEKICDLAEGLGRTVATPDEVRRMLGLKGVEHVDF